MASRLGAADARKAIKRMGDPRKAELVGAYADAFAGWRELLERLDPGAWATPTGCPGWDAKDQLAHVVAVERIMLGDRQPAVELPADQVHVRSEFGRLVEMGVQARRAVPMRGLKAEAEETFARRLDQLADLDPAALDEQVDGPAPGMRMRATQMLRTRMYDITTHEYDVRRAVGAVETAPRGAHLAVSKELIVRGWSRVLPPALGRDGVLAVEIDGEEVARLDLGDGTLHRGEDGPRADAVLAGGVAQLLAIAGGRDDAPGAVEVTARGDAELVGAVLAAGVITP